MLRMLNLFKQRLLKEGRIKSFLLHTIGEVFLIVVGIFIAIQLDRLNEKRKDTIQRQAYVASLLSDLKKDSLMIKNHLKKLDNALQSHQTLSKKLDAFKTPSRALIDTAYMNFRSSFFSVIGFNDNTFEILKSTGDLSLFDRKEQELLLHLYKSQEALIKGNHTNRNAYLTTATEYWKLVLVGRDKYRGAISNEVLQQIWLDVTPETFIPIYQTTTGQQAFAFQVEKSQLIVIDSLNNQLLSSLSTNE